MKPLKKLSTAIILGVILTTSTGCSEFITAKLTVAQELAQKADAFYDVLESEDTYAAYVKLDADTAHLSDWEKSRILRNAPGMEHFDNYNEDNILANYGYLKSSVNEFHEKREQGKSITLDIPEEAIVMVGDSNASVDLAKATVSVNGTPIENDVNTPKKGIALSERSDKWSIIIDYGVETYIIPKTGDGKDEGAYIQKYKYAP